MNRKIMLPMGVLVASNVICYQNTPHAGFAAIDFFHFAFYIAIYVFARLLIEEGRARERAAQAHRERADHGRPDR